MQICDQTGELVFSLRCMGLPVMKGKNLAERLRYYKKIINNRGRL